MSYGSSGDPWKKRKKRKTRMPRQPALSDGFWRELGRLTRAGVRLDEPAIGFLIPLPPDEETLSERFFYE